MNHKLMFRFSVIFALVALLVNALTVCAYPAETPETTPNMQYTNKVHCYEILRTAKKVADGIDIPSRRAEYAALDRIGYCILVTGVHTTIPATGVTWADRRFMEMKDRQAEQMDKSGYPVQRQIDPRFLEFKERQADDRMGP